jgi:predicted anti-sigma-YlaC factor YlaD
MHGNLRTLRLTSARTSISLAGNVRLEKLAIALVASAACSPTNFALTRAAHAIASTGSGGAFARDDDPELVGDAIPFALKSMESLADRLKDDAPLRLGMARGFTQYAYGWVQMPADEMAGKNLRQAMVERARAAKLYLRARRYGLDGLRLQRGVTEEQLRGAAAQRDQALAKVEKGDVPMLYWTMTAWGGAIALRKTDLELVGDVPAVAAMLDRALQLDEPFEDGALHEFAIQLDPARPEGTTPQKQRAHFDRARELQKGKKISALVTYAESVVGPAQDRRTFESLLDEVLKFDVDAPNARDDRLANILSQRRAAYLRAHEDDILSD